VSFKGGSFQGGGFKGGSSKKGSSKNASSIKKTAIRGLFVLGIWIALSVILVLMLDRVIMPWLVRHNRQIEVPDVVEMTLAEAESTLVQQGLLLVEDGQEYDPFIPPGMVLSQSPEGGTLVKGKGRSVRVIVSKGGERVTVPNLQGVSLRQARLLLDRVGLGLGKISWIYTEDFPQDVVISSAPGYKAEVYQGEVVDLLASQGPIPPTAIVPNFVGQSLEGAILLARDAGLKIGTIAYRQDEKLLPETVLEQSVGAGEEIERDSIIDLVVSTID
jgi:serine/threonine-protein kinase